ncbi:MAG: hypothetical protein ACJ77K_09520 [Bacteroidia bacterium]
MKSILNIIVVVGILNLFSCHKKKDGKYILSEGLIITETKICLTGPKDSARISLAFLENKYNNSCTSFIYLKSGKTCRVENNETDGFRINRIICTDTSNNCFMYCEDLPTVKFYFKNNNWGIPFEFENHPLQVEQATEMKLIAGYPCKKIIKHGSEYDCTIYYTDSLQVPFRWNNMITEEGVNGFIMERVRFFSGYSETTIVKVVASASVSDEHFHVPVGYIEMDPDSAVLLNRKKLEEKYGSPNGGLNADYCGKWKMKAVNDTVVLKIPCNNIGALGMRCTRTNSGEKGWLYKQNYDLKRVGNYLFIGTPSRYRVMVIDSVSKELKDIYNPYYVFKKIGSQ